jgi:serine/threonine protein kinase
MKCPKCAAENREEASFCERCGNALVKKCPNCGTTLRPTAAFCDKCGNPLTPQTAPGQPVQSTQSSSIPTSFANGRYQVKKFLGEGGKKKVYLAHDTVLDRDVSFYLIKTEKLDEAARARIKRAAPFLRRLPVP